MKFIYTSDRILTDKNSEGLIELLQSQEADIGLNEAFGYFDYPRYADYEEDVHKADILILSKNKGVIAFKVEGLGRLFDEEVRTIDAIDDSLDQFASELTSRLMKSRHLRRDRKTLKFDIIPIIYMPGRKRIDPDDLLSEAIYSEEALVECLKGIPESPISDAEYEEIRSVIEGAKALSRGQKRIIDNPEKEKYAAALSKLESEIANFDQDQRKSALSTIPGPQRIRGLAGSGKTIILAMKAAHLHISNPDAKILVTFYTKSLQDTFKQIITRFYRHFKDEAPNWKSIHVRHGWGGASRRGVYYDACMRLGILPTNYKTAARESGNPFEYVCRELVSKGVVKPYYDYVLIDEGQDFPSSFYQLCYALTKGKRDETNIIWAYDDLQNIMNVKMRTDEQLFGLDEDGKPRVSLDRASKKLPPTAENDLVLSKCYRNQREVLVVAHALGFGIYSSSNIVQLLESAEHWEDVGYSVEENNNMTVGQQVRIFRPAENSPVAIDSEGSGPIIECFLANEFHEEINWITEQIGEFIEGGLAPQEIVVIALDDRNARTYFTKISEQLALRGISTNNILADPYNEPPFSIDGKVTLSTVYRAKGNEAAAIFTIGIDGVKPKIRGHRNRIFTAFTRSKAWLRVSGLGPRAASFIKEIETALENFPRLNFTMPNLQEIETIQRDLTTRAEKRQQMMRVLRERGFSIEDIVTELGADPDDV